MSDGSEADPSGLLNPYKKRVATGPTPPNQPESTTIVFPGQEHPRAATPDVFHQEDTSQSNRHLTPETTGVDIKQQSGPVKWADTRRKQ